MGMGPHKVMKSVDQLQLCPSPVTAAEVSVTLPFVIPSEAEGPAVRSFVSADALVHLLNRVVERK
jgi:hypothetical protein